jgi:hypothetical protein
VYLPAQRESRDDLLVPDSQPEDEEDEGMVAIFSPDMERTHDH